MPAITHPRLLELPTRFDSEKIVLRAYRAGDGAALFNAVNEDREDLSQWLAGERDEILPDCGPPIRIDHQAEP